MKDVEDICPLSPMQHGMLFHCVLHPEAGAYVSQMACGFGESFHPEAFAKAWQAVVDRHPIFRTGFVWEGLDEPMQVVFRQTRVRVETPDWSGMPEAEREARLETFLQEERARAFDFNRPSLIRLAIVRMGPEDHRFVWTYHHLLLDGWSESLIYSDLFRFYFDLVEGREPKPEPAPPYADYVSWLRAQDASRAEAFWRDALAGFREPTPVRSDPPPAALPDGAHVHALREVRLSSEESDALRELARRCRVTSSTVFQASWALLLSHLSGTQDVVYGMTVSGRPAELPGVEAMVGPFINTVPVRIGLSRDETLAAWLPRVQDGILELRRWEFSPLVQVQAWSEIPRGRSLFDTLLVFQSPIRNDRLQKQHGRIESLGVRGVRHGGGWTNYALSADVRHREETVIHLSYDRCRLSDTAVERLGGDYETLLRAMAAGPGAAVGAILDLAAEASRARRSRAGSDLEAANRERLRRVRRQPLAATALTEEAR